MYNPITNFNLARCLIVLSLLTAATSAFAEERNVKYQDVFYPDGMPIIEGPLGTGPAVYEYYGEAEIPENNLLFILHSEKIPGERFYSDYSYTAYISIAKNTKPGPTIISTIDVTGYTTTSIEECQGCFALMAGDLDVFPLTNDMKILHLSIGSTISGTGGVSSSSDVFFLVDSVNNTLMPALELWDTTTYARAGTTAEEYSDTFIYMQMDEILGAKILTQKYKYEFDEDEGINISVLDPNINVYAYDFDNNKYVLKEVLSAINKAYGIGLNTCRP